MNYIVTRPDGSLDVLERTAPLSLAELQNLVSGYIEAVGISGTLMNRYGRKVTAMVNEEGRLLNLPENPFFEGLCGNAVIGKTEGGEFVGLNERETKDARHWLSQQGVRAAMKAAEAEMQKLRVFRNALRDNEFTTT